MDLPVLTQATQVFQKFCVFFCALSRAFLKGIFDHPFKMLLKKPQGDPQKKHKNPEKLTQWEPSFDLVFWKFVLLLVLVFQSFCALARASFLKICALARASFLKFCALARASFLKICALARASFLKICALARASFSKILCFPLMTGKKN